MSRLRVDDQDPFVFTGYLLRRAQQTHVALWQEHIPTETSGIGYGVLALLERFPDISQRDLCDALDLDRSTIADLVARLERRGLIERTRSPRDRRRNTLRLTAAGRKETDRIRPYSQSVEDALMHGLTDPERQELRRLLRVVTATALEAEARSSA